MHVAQHSNAVRSKLSMPEIDYKPECCWLVWTRWISIVAVPCQGPPQAPAGCAHNSNHWQTSFPSTLLTHQDAWRRKKKKTTQTGFRFQTSLSYNFCWECVQKWWTVSYISQLAPTKKGSQLLKSINRNPFCHFHVTVNTGHKVTKTSINMWSTTVILFSFLKNTFYHFSV